MKISILSIPLLSMVALSCMSVLFTIPMYSHEYSITIDLPFDEDVFTMVNNEYGQTEIITNDKVFYPEENKPGLPLIPINIAIPSDKQYYSNFIEVNKRLSADNVIITQSPVPIPTDRSLYHKNIDILYDTDVVYPDNNCRYISTTNCNGAKTLHFLCCPYIYDSKLHKLYFIDSIRLNISLVDDKSIQASEIKSEQLNLLKSAVINPLFFDSMVIEETKALSSSTNIDNIDYVIITNNDLKSSFEPLRLWKTVKGIKTVIITTEQINSSYSGPDLQVKIKKCLYDLYSNNSLTYALLGGDDKIIPVRGCYGKVNDSKIDKNIPTDMYYACFGGDFEWNQNENDIYGELDDNIDLAQNIFVTRAPVYTTSDTESFVNKIIEYETNPTFNESILTCGNNLYNEGKRGISDAQILGTNLYSKYIQPYWNGKRFMFYDTYTDFESGKDYELNAENLFCQIDKGYSFIEMTTHGQQTHWELENGKYNSAKGLSQINSAQTIITTIACHTNAFDTSSTGASDPCLSESFIRNPKSGIIAYLGSSREGWGFPSRLGTSHLYEANFFEKLFTEDIVNKNYGVIISAAKYAMLSNCNAYNSTRWVQFSLNPIGDPEMPIYTTKPYCFENLHFNINRLGIYIDTAIKDCRICITDEWDYGEGFYEKIDNKQFASFANLPSQSVICISKQNYIPKILYLNIIQNKIFTANRTFKSDIIVTGSSVTTSEKSGDVEFASGTYEINGSNVVIGPGTKIAFGARVSINK